MNSAVPETEGIKYAGSKLKILPYIFDVISDLPVTTVLDGFSGSTRVSQAFAKKGLSVTANDTAVWSATFATAYLLNKKSKREFAELIEHLNSLKGYHGWFSENYGGLPESDAKRPFQMKNAMRLDAIRDEIEKLGLSGTDKAVALTSLIYALDSVDSTLGHYCAYLSEWSPRSYHDMVLKVPGLFESAGNHSVVRGDIFSLLKKKRHYDLAYFDPPYGSNNDKMPPSRVRYGSYYHIWTTVINNDRPALFGKANRREDSRDSVAASVFEEFRKSEDGKFIAMEAIARMIRQTDARYVLLSYSSGGRATKQELFDILQSNGRLLRTVEIDYKSNVMATMRWTNEWVNSTDRTKEYLFLIEKR